MPISVPPGERIIYQAKPHWIRLFWPALLTIAGLFCSLCTLITGTAKPPPGQPPPPDGMIGTFATCSACIFGLAMIWLILAVKEYITSDFILTNRRIILEVGMLRRCTLDMYLKHIDSLYVNRSLLGQWLGYGTINVRSHASSPWRFHIAKAEEVRRYIQEQIARQV